MGVFDMFKKTKNNFKEEASFQKIDFEFWLPDALQAQIFVAVQSAKHATDAAMRNSSKESIDEMHSKLKVAVHKAKSAEDYLSQKGLNLIKKEHLVSAFYLVNLSDVPPFKTIEQHSDMEIKNVMATFISASGYEISNADQISSVSVQKIRLAAKWLDSHPTN